MTTEMLHYDRMVENALKGVLREALTASIDGLPGDHHFYITFRTRHPDVGISTHLMARYPEEMTIVLQHQYWGLEVTPDWFEVTLSFNRVNERLHIPFAAVTAFADPSAKFGLQFHVDLEEETDADSVPLETEAAPVPEHAESRPAVTETEGDSKVVTLDAFRKK